MHEQTDQGEHEHVQSDKGERNRDEREYTCEGEGKECEQERSEEHAYGSNNTKGETRGKKGTGENRKGKLNTSQNTQEH